MPITRGEANGFIGGLDKEYKMHSETESPMEVESPWSALDIEDLRRLQDALNRITLRAALEGLLRRLDDRQA